MPILPVPVIDFTDLYHPYQDPGDNFDILAPYAMEEIDLRAVILDITDRLRQTPDQRVGHDDNLAPGDPGARDPGVIPITQCNYLFDRNVPFAAAPFTPLRSPDDTARDAPQFQQRGIELFLQTLHAAARPVDVLVFCSCRGLAIAFNREPELLREKIRRLHLSIGTSIGETFDMDWAQHRGKPVAAGSKGFLEWNVALDPHAFVRVLKSGLPMSIYPCAGPCGPFAMDRHNTFYELGDLSWVEAMSPRLRNYLGYAFTRSSRPDFLRALEGSLPDDAAKFFCTHKRHAVWETAIWLEVSGRKLVRRANGTHRIVRASKLATDDTVIAGAQRPAEITAIESSGRFSFRLTGGDGCVTIFDRGDDLDAYQNAMREAVPLWYQSFTLPASAG